MTPVEKRLELLERRSAQQDREIVALRKEARQASPLSTRHGRFVGITAEELNEDGTVDVTVWYWGTVAQDEWREGPVIENVRAFDETTVIPLSAKVYVFHYENTWVLLPLESDIVEIVEVFHDTPAADGDIVEANSDGYHPGRIVTYDADHSYVVGADIWIQFVDGMDGHDTGTDDGAVLACEGEYYGPAKFTGEMFDLVENEGEEDETHDERPVYVVECSERQFLCKADSSISKGSSGTVSLYNADETDSTINRTAKALFAAISTSKWCIYHRIAGKWYVSKAEC